ncbi:MAG: glucosidase [Leptolyngbyaceae bacterium]|nr:glucosidase [Leptolyngbyaceae bacterium]
MASDEKLIMTLNAEQLRLQETRDRQIPWKKWGPYLSERQWGTVREDYSALGNAWDYFSHDQSRSRAYRWGEDGIAGISDDQQQLCFAIALWNGKDPILKERLFGLTNSEGNHGEDVKEYYFYLDSTPTHSYMKYLYKYPQAAYPYVNLVETNRSRNAYELEYELLDTDIFDQDRYFDIYVEYAKQSPEDILIQVTMVNRGPDQAELHLLPTLWFRNTWSWHPDQAKPILRQTDDSEHTSTLVASHPQLGDRYLYCDASVPLLFTENETNTERIFGTPNASPYVKDGINNYVVLNRTNAVNPQQVGTKASAHYQLVLGAGQTQTIHLRLTHTPPPETDSQVMQGFAENFQARQQEADTFYENVISQNVSEDARNVMRQALAGLLWTKQYYYYDVGEWRKGDEVHKYLAANRNTGRNQSWFNLVAEDIISMPDKWEYPWFAAWDLAFHTIPLALVDLDFAKEQLELMIRVWYMHPNGQLPAYEWNFSDVNPPVHGLAAWRIYLQEQQQRGQGDRDFLARIFQKLLMNFTWWVNRKDVEGKNVFQGGFLGLDNIGIFDRSAPLPTGVSLTQSDGTSWMAMYCLNLMQIALELAKEDPVYQEMAYKFYEHFVHIAAAMDRVGIHEDELWDQEDGFFYDFLQLPNGQAIRIKVRSLVGLLSLGATLVMSGEHLHHRTPELEKRLLWLTQHHPELTQTLTNLDKPGPTGMRMLSVLNEDKLRRILARLLDPAEFLSDYGIRSMSRFYKDHPFIYSDRGQYFRVDYEPAESTTGMFGGNSNWRGPIWFPMNLILIEALLKLHCYYGNEFKVECPTGSGRMLTLLEVVDELANRLTQIFLRNEEGERPVYGETKKFQTDPHWRDLILFYEYFHGDNGAGIGASHQTGWTALVATMIQLHAEGLETYRPEPVEQTELQPKQREASLLSS